MKNIIIFDLDGTLVDSAPEILDAVNRVWSGRGYDPFDLPTLISFVGKGLPNLIQLAMKAREVEASEYQDLHDEVLGIYNAADGALTKPYDGVEDMLETLVDQGFLLGICTNKPEEAARQVLRVFGWDSLFESVVGGDTFAARKPDPQPLNAVWQALGAGPMLYVGDSETDAETAVAAKAKFALFTEGYRKKPVQALAHDFVFSDYARFMGIVDEVFGDRG
ncbi:phosphoglycolate phosphatase [Shimia haliotis]|uniref:phosphoglycolate phosphatase n=1 Tax=Shimia haliotis TaxID=1280847 RepID=A0A1I4A468_9RHOB|nr:phosphoglycolate phosphatase [Shimia haliotis]SFK51125.1 phosphoglycolate phosphatase [Shimia haliotis]